MRKWIAPLAAFALVGLAGCSGNEAASATGDNSAVETNLGSIEEPLANDSAFDNETLSSNDSAGTLEAADTTIADPTLNASGNTTAR